jgi:pyruvate/2-oxoglutarate dehydrogenase complex dihydrolipoamide dehydrogenase (E3) component
MSQGNEQAVGLMRLSAEDKRAARTSASAHESTASSHELSPDLCIIGGGSGGLSVAAAAAQLGMSVVLVEKHKMGGDCLNYGCVPSKALIAASRRAHVMRSVAPFGIAPVNPSIDHHAVHRHIQAVIAAVAPNDSVERFTGLGVQVIKAAGHFAGRRTVQAGDYRIKARRFVIATGSSPAIPPIQGLDNVPHFTNETIFENREKPDHLVVVGAGPVGLELAQAYLRLGSRVTVIEAQKALSRDDPEMSGAVLRRLRAEGLQICEGTVVEGVSGGARSIDVHASADGNKDVVHCTHLLIATGRVPNTAGLNLEAAGIRYGKAGIKVNRALKTSNRKVFAIGDVIGGAQFTHVANHHAGIVIRRTVFRQPARVDNAGLSWVTFTDPELAHVGLTEEQARQQHGKVLVYRWPYHENDRAQAERATEGHIKVVTDGTGRIRGASIVGEQAGELIQMWSLALSQGLSIKAMTQWVSPYPTLSEINKRAAFGYYATAAAKPLVRKVIGLLRRFG